MEIAYGEHIRVIVALARKEAARFGHASHTPEHLLLALVVLLEQPELPADLMALRSMINNIGMMRREALGPLRRLSCGVGNGMSPSPEAREVLSHAREFARQAGRGEVEVEHFLQALHALEDHDIGDLLERRGLGCYALNAAFVKGTDGGTETEGLRGMPSQIVKPFSDECQQLFTEAAALARNKDIQPEHYLLAMLQSARRDPSPTWAQLLGRLLREDGVLEDKLDETLAPEEGDAETSPESEESDEPFVPQPNRASRIVLRLAETLSPGEGIELSHLLAALMKDPSTSTAKLMEAHGLNYEDFWDAYIGKMQEDMIIMGGIEQERRETQ